MDETNLPSNFWTSNEVTVKFTWYAGSDLKNFEPFTQVYGVCFNEKGEILIQRFKDSDWCLPGGTVEVGEDALETLRREFIEEVDTTIKNPILMGGQRVQFIKGHNKNITKAEGDDFYQLRYYCEVGEVLPQTPDPDHGDIRERKFVKPEEITKYFDWGDTGAAIFKQATNLWYSLHPKQSGE